MQQADRMQPVEALDAGLALDLSGSWRFELDPDDVGAAQKWWRRSLAGEISLPGSLQAQGYGNDVTLDTPWVGLVRGGDWYNDPQYRPFQPEGELRFPFWLQPQKHYMGVAWYQRTVRIPDAWAGRRVFLRMERVHWGSTVWVDDAKVGSDDTLSVPHEYDLTPYVQPGEHTITVRIDNRMLVDVGENAHSVSDHTQTNWNGAVGELILRATDRVWIDDVQVYPDVAKRRVRVRIEVGNGTGAAVEGELHLAAEGYNTPAPHVPPPLGLSLTLGTAREVVEAVYELGPEAQLWDEFHPALYRLTVALSARDAGGGVNAAQYADVREVTFGLREFGVEGTQFTVNGRKTFLRGTLECAIFPHTGYPPTEVESWRRILKIVKAHGLNHVRFHSWCPPKAAFIAADEEGVYYQVECGVWTWFGKENGLEEWLTREAERIVREYGNHPSFALMAHGNEPYGDHVEFLKQWVRSWQAKDPRRLYTTGAGWPVVPESDFHSTPDPRIQRWGEELKSRINALPPATTADYRDWVEKLDGPIVSHEIGQWCAYPNFDEIEKYTGFLKARNFELFRDSLAAHHMGDQARDFLMASGKLQTICYKEDIESALRTPGFGGFQLLDLHDFPGQGTALVGVLDAFWESKGYVTPAEYRRFCNSTVLLARMERRVFTESVPFAAKIEIAHFGPEPLRDAVVHWRLLDERGKCVRRGKLAAGDIPIGNGIGLGEVAFGWEGLPTARRYRLEAYLEGYDCVNDWDVWLFPDHVPTEAPAGVAVATDLDGPALERLEAGGKVLLLVDPERVDTDVQIGFSPVFWNTVWTDGQAPHTLGLLCNPEHPALRSFPTEFHSNWQWWELVHGAAAMELEALPPELRPIVQPIDTWFRNKRLGLLFEAKVGAGKLMVCSMDLTSDLDKRPVARQMRYSVLQYMASGAFDPAVAVDVEALRSLWKRE